jgi:hypothetical protein
MTPPAPPYKSVATLNDLSPEQVEEARSLLSMGPAKAAVYLQNLVVKCHLDDAADFIDDVLRGSADARTWGRKDWLCAPKLSAGQLISQSLADTLRPLDGIEGERWMREVPGFVDWRVSYHSGAPAVLVRGRPYWCPTPDGITCLTLNKYVSIEEVTALPLAMRRWIALRVAQEFRARALPATRQAIGVALGVAGQLSRDGEIAVDALLREQTLEQAADGTPGFRGPDEWFA